MEKSSNRNKEHLSQQPFARTSRQQQALERREHILTAALHLFATQGFAATTTKQIAQAVDLAEGSLFHYFPDKISLLTALAQQHAAFAGTVLLLLDQSANRPLREVMEDLTANFVTLAYQERDFVSMLLNEGQFYPELANGLQAFLASITDTLAEYLAMRVKAGEVRIEVSLSASAHLFISSLLLFFMTHRHLSWSVWQQQATTHAQTILNVWLGAVAVP